MIEFLRDRLSANAQQMDWHMDGRNGPHGLYGHRQPPRRPVFPGAASMPSMGSISSMLLAAPASFSPKPKKKKSPGLCKP